MKPPSKRNFKLLEDEWHKLVVKSATGKITQTQTLRLNELQALRRSILCPRSKREIAAEKAQHKKFCHLMHLIDTYIKKPQKEL